jgi:hypothetical protein
VLLDVGRGGGLHRAIVATMEEQSMAVPGSAWRGAP